MSSSNPLLATLLPTVATALGGPLAGAALSWFTKETGIATPTAEALVSTLSSQTPERLAELKAKDSEFQLALSKLGYDSLEKIESLNAQVVLAVNTTMQTEAGADHWPTYSWRPFIGFTFGLYVCSLWMLPLLGKTPVNLTPDIVLAIGGILGVASYFRGKAQADPRVPTDNRG